MGKDSITLKGVTREIATEKWFDLDTNLYYARLAYKWLRHNGYEFIGGATPDTKRDPLILFRTGYPIPRSFDRIAAEELKRIKGVIITMPNAVQVLIFEPWKE